MVSKGFTSSLRLNCSALQRHEPTIVLARKSSQGRRAEIGRVVQQYDYAEGVTMSENLGDVFEVVAQSIEPGAPAIVCDGETLTWADFDSKSNALARRLLEAGLGVQAKVGLYMRNGPDYLIAFIACFKARLCSFNINYRYGPEEVEYLFDNADCECVIFDDEFASVLKATPSFGRLKLKLVARGFSAGAEQLSAVYASDTAPLGNERDPDDIFLQYTGGTTGLPKGVMWPSGAMWENLRPGFALPGKQPPSTRHALADQVRSGEGRFRFYIAPPLMHGTGLITALGILGRGGSVALSGRPSFDAERVVQELVELHCDGLSIVGDAFARPILEVLRAAPNKYDVSHIRAVSSSGMMWSPDVKMGLLEFMPDAYLIDGLGASESSAFASSTTTRGMKPGEARFDLAGAIVVRPDDLTPVKPGSGEIGILAKAGPLPLGYYKDDERTARTYVLINGERYVLGGDHATIEADGSIRLLGRGSHCINTAGEKVYPEEVEEALKTHRSVRDALVFGVPDPRFGQAVVAVASTGAPVEAEALIAHVRARLAPYKAPRRIVIVEETPRSPNGKADYQGARALFEAAGAR
jgi:acyl-CoA synthetase (AMP-forming)/AMP-acid ligase II